VRSRTSRETWKGNAMNEARFVYATYIAASPEKVWNALVDGEMTRQYWGHFNVSDWKVGSTWKHQRSDGTNKIDLAGKVLESVPPRRLVITWAFPGEVEVPEKVSRVTFDIEPYKGEHVRLTLVHDELEPGSEMERGITSGWPLVLSNLKSFLETGEAMPL
jgi:uncharacterized protein YndB with AHSA1/START domain